MTPPNPTHLRLGARGTLAGREWKVIGRVVMCVDDGGALYWNEFQLQAGVEERAILVYEETRRGGEWRFFTRFEPETPLSIDEATGVTRDDLVHLDGTDTYVTFIGTSCVSVIDGWAPKTEFAGKEERYFNAEAGNKMVVASWTPQEIEFYTGETLLPGVAERAFRIGKAARSEYAINRYGGGSNQTVGLVVVVAVVCLLPFMILGLSSCNGLTARAPSVRVFGASFLPVTSGKSIVIHGVNYTVDVPEEVEISEEGLRFDRHEMTLEDRDGKKALLIAGLRPEGRIWCLQTPVNPNVPLTPGQAGNIAAGRIIWAGGIGYTVSELFECKSDLNSWDPTNITYGFAAQSGSNVLVARWNESGITFEAGMILSRQDVAALKDQFK